MTGATPDIGRPVEKISQKMQSIQETMFSVAGTVIANTITGTSNLRGSNTAIFTGMQVNNAATAQITIA